MKKGLIVALSLLLAVLLGLLGWLVYLNHTYVTVDGIRYRRDTRHLDLSGQVLSDPQAYARLTLLESLDLRDTGLRAEDYDALRAALPGCEIRWCPPFQGAFYPEDTAHFTPDTLSPADVAALCRFPALVSVDAGACRDYDAIALLMAELPHVQVRYVVPMGSRLLPQDTKALSLSGCSIEELTFALAWLPELAFVDATGCHDYDALSALSAGYPNCAFRYTVEIGGTQWGNDATELLIHNPDPLALAAALPHLPQARTVRLEGEIRDLEGVFGLKTAFPDIRFLFDFTVMGIPVNSMTRELDLSGIAMESTAAVEQALRGFYQMERLTMCDCGISNEDMDSLVKRYPETRFVWTVDIGRRIRLRTDATYLMPYQYGTKLTDKDLANLRYCVDIICIDFGHSEVSDLSFLAYMPHMKYLLLGDTRVSDISVCAGLQELAFVELFMTDVKDYSPLIQCPALRDLNISYALPDNVDDLCRITQLENLWMKGYWWPDGKAQLREALPNATIVFSTPGEASATDHGWRWGQQWHPHRPEHRHK